MLQCCLRPEPPFKPCTYKAADAPSSTGNPSTIGYLRPHPEHRIISPSSPSAPWHTGHTTQRRSSALNFLGGIAPS